MKKITFLFLSLVSVLAFSQKNSQEQSVQRAGDRDAMMAIYNAMDTSTWFSRDNWGSSLPLNDWFGVTADAGDVVTAINLPDNGLQGTLPDFSVLNSLSTLRIDNNDLQFGDFEAQFTSYTANIANFTYAPQNSAGPVVQQFLSLGDSATIQAGVSGVLNTYQWYKDGVLIPSATNSSYTVNINTAADFGYYYCDVSSNLVINLTIRSADYLMQQDATSHPDYPALMALYNALNGPSWANSTNWGTGNPLDTWDGVSLDPNTNRVNSLILSSNGLFGSLPVEIGLLQELTYLDLSSNSIYGQIPIDFWNLTQLNYLDVRNNQLDGSLPGEIGNLGVLQTLNLSNNFFDGSLPVSIPDMANLTELIISSNNFVGNIPNLTGLNNLNRLQISDNNFQFGDFESQFTTLNTNLGIFVYTPQKRIGTEQGYGLPINGSVTLISEASGVLNTYQWFKDGVEIPGATGSSYTATINTTADYGNYTYQVSSNIVLDLTLESNTILIDIEGTSHPDYPALMAFYNATGGPNWNTDTNWGTTAPVSTWFGLAEANGRVSRIDFANNNLQGGLPPEIGDLVGLDYMQLAAERGLVGSIPPEIGNLPQITWLEFDGTGLSGQVPVEMTNLSTLTILALWNNNFSGQLPDFSGVTSLEYLVIRNNDFQFGDFEAQYATYTANIPNFWYEPQRKVGTGSQNVLAINSSITFQTEVSGVLNTYQWFKNGVEIPGATGTSYELTINSIDDYGTYTYQANSNIVLNLTLESNDFNVEPTGTSHPDYPALMALYNATGGPDWTNNTNWGTDVPVSSWNGVRLENGRVQEISLFNNNLVGSLPPEIGDLSELEILIVSYNSGLTGTIPAEIGNLVKLDYLSLRYNDLQGSIPSSLVNLNLAQYIFLRGNNFSGVFPDITGLTNLLQFSIDENSFQFGDIENEFASYLTSLGPDGFIYAPQNKVGVASADIVPISGTKTFTVAVSGSQNTYQWFKDGVSIDGATADSYQVTVNTVADYGVYTCLINSGIVTGLTLESEDFVIGEDPTSHPDYAALVALYNSTNGANWTNNDNWIDTTAPLESWFGIALDPNTGRVSEIVLESNNLVGPLPTEIGDLTGLVSLLVRSNQLSGSIPASIGNLVNMQTMSVFNNQLTGSIPAEIWNLTNLNTLYLSSNQLTGTLSEDIGNLTQIVNFSVNQNNLTGNIPAAMATLSNAFYFGLQNNQFSGTIPDLTNIPNFNILRILGNNFQFGDFEDQFNAYQTFNTFTYSPQGKIGTLYEESVALGGSTVLQTAVSGSQNTYQWMKDGVEIAGATGTTYTVNVNTTADYGIYSYIAYSSIVSGLILSSEDFIISGNPTITAKVFLQGAMLGATDGLMKDDVRANGLLPFQSPYPDDSIVDDGWLVDYGDDSMVDWILIELRSAADNTVVVDSKSFLVKRNGFIVTNVNQNELVFDAPPGDYYIALKHRNHLSIMTATTHNLNGGVVNFDFTNGSVDLYGSNALTNYGTPTNSWAMWAGNNAQNGTVRFVGAGSGSASIKNAVVTDPGNLFGSLGFAPSGYAVDDVTMNGITAFLGAGSDVALIKANILNHPANVFGSLSFSFQEQMP